MWFAFKALTWKVKAGIIGVILVVLLAVIGSTAYVSYHKGLNIAAVQISRYETAAERINSRIQIIQGQKTVEIVTKYKDRVNTVDRVVYQTRNVIRDNVVPTTKLTKGWIYSYNQSVQGLDVDPVLAADATPASVSDVDALADTIVPNNGIALKYREQILALQEWIHSVEQSRLEALNAK